MTEKLQPYDILCALVPGVLFLCAVGVAFPQVVPLLEMPSVPNAFAVLALTILAVFLGHMIQAIASFLEPALHWSWGGRPSEKAFTDGLGDRYLPIEMAVRIAGKLKEVLGADASNRSLFLYAMALAESDGCSRASTFNGLYAYHRALLVLAIAAVTLVGISGSYGALSVYSWRHFISLLIVLLLITAILWHRCKQRAFYYVREVLGTADRILTKVSSGCTNDGKE